MVEGVTSKSSSLAGPSGASSGSAASSDLPPLQVVPAVVNSNGSRFHDGPLAKGFCRIGWENPLSLWRSQLQDEVKSFIFPASDVQAYSNLREQWHLMFCQRSPMFYWLLQMEEHSFYLFLIKVMATRSIRARSSLLSPRSREVFWLWLPSAQTIYVLNSSFTSLSGTTIARCPMWPQSWSMSVPLCLCICHWTKTLPSLWRQAGNTPPVDGEVAAILLQVADQQEVNGFYLLPLCSFLPSALWCLALQSLFFTS